MATKKKKKLTATQKEKNRLARKIRSNVKELNRQIGIIKREMARGTYATDYTTVTTTFEMMRMLTNTKSKYKLGTGRLTHMSLESLRMLEDYTSNQRKLKVFNTTERRAMFNKAWNTLNNRYFPDGGGLTRNEYQELISLFNNRTLGEFTEQHALDSDQMVQMIIDRRDKNPNKAGADIVDAFKQARKVFNFNGTKIKQVFNKNPNAIRNLINIFLDFIDNKINEDEKEDAVKEFKDKYNI